ncbi:MAG: histidine phosphatase family protein, partial [Actinomycetota bacterium]
RAQAEDAARRFEDVKLTAVCASDLIRASDTARSIAEAQGLSVITDPRFREIDQGEWTGLEVEEIGRRWPELWGPARHYSKRPGGESPQEVRARALAGLRDVVEAHPEGTVVIVSHGGTIRWLAAEALGYDDRRSARIRGLGNGQAVKMRVGLEQGVLTFGAFARLDGSTADLDDPND